MLSYQEKMNILSSFSQLHSYEIKYNKTNFYYDGSKTRRKIIARELRPTGNGYIYTGFLEEFKGKRHDDGFSNIDRVVNSEVEFRLLIQKVIDSFN